MPSMPYDLVKDDQDIRVPLHAEQAFFRGITFQAKFIGWQEVPRPENRLEIVQAMRRIRYECKVQNLKKRKVTVHISVDGVKVLLLKKKRRRKQWHTAADEIELMSHPIYRIFYVSHDSSDLKIFSYIARDGSTDTFRCSVFKSNKKSQAMRIVRTVGQAFEVCHKFSLQKEPVDINDERSDHSSEILYQDRILDQLSEDDVPKKGTIPVTPDLSLPKRPNHLELPPQATSNFRKSPCSDIDRPPSSPISTTKEIQQLKEQLEQQTLQTRQALAQLMLVREQLISETNARIEAQARTQQLLQQNRELLEHLASLGGYTEPDRGGLTAANIGLAPQLSSTAKVARWFQQLPWNSVSLSRPESGFVSGDSRSERNPEEHSSAREHDELCDEFLLVEGSATLWTKLNAKKRRKLLAMRFGKLSPSSIPGTYPSPQHTVTWSLNHYKNEYENSETKSVEMQHLRSPSKKRKSIFSFQEYSQGTLMENNSPLDPNVLEDISEDEDYSISVSAIMQRRASIRGTKKKGYRSPRRTSSPLDNALGTTGFSGDRRRSSVFTSSSAETAMSIEEATNQDSSQEQIYENIRLHKEVLQSVKLQPWSMRRKLRLVRQAKAYIAKHEGALQERFAMSRSTRDLWARFKILITARWQHWRRELANFSTILIPWEIRIKEIESHFGSVVASYFTFLRWLLWVNIIIAALLSIFVIVPELLASDHNFQDDRKHMTPGELKSAGNFMTIWEFNGYLKYSPLFYGFYSNVSGAVRWGYNLPLAYFLTGLVVYMYSFIATLRKMAENSRSSKLSSKDDECIFSWKVFAGWDFMIGHAETAHNRIASIVLGFKEALLEEAEKKKDKRNWKVILVRIMVNIIVTGLLVASAYAVIMVVDRSEDVEAHASWWRRNEITIIMNLISFFFPMFFEVLGFLESCHPRQQLRLQLARIMILNLLSLYSLIFALFFKITAKTDSLERLRDIVLNATTEKNLLMRILNKTKEVVTTPISSGGNFGFNATEIDTNFMCFESAENCSNSRNLSNMNLSTSFLLLNLSSTLISDGSFNLTEVIQNGYDYGERAQLNNSSFLYYYEDDSMQLNNESSNQEIQRHKRWSETTITSNDTQTIDDFSLSEELSVYEQMSMFYANLSDNPFINDSYAFNITDKFLMNTSNLIENITMSATDETLSTLSTEFNNETLYNYQELTTSSNTKDTMTEFMDERIDFTISSSNQTENSSSEDYFLTESKENQTYDEPGFSYMNTTEDFVLTGTEAESTQPSYIDIKRQQEEALRNVTITLARAKRNLTSLCWETMLGQEMAKVVVSDLVMVIALSLALDFFRALFVRYLNRCWCWDLEKKFPQYGDFKIAENLLHLVFNQGQVWMGLFFSPGLAIINLAKLLIIMYIRSWIVLTCNVPHEVVFRASRSNNFYLTLLLTMLFLCVLPVGYAIVWLRPSWHCGPFSDFGRMSEFFTSTIRNALPDSLHKPMEYITSSSTVIPLLLLLILIIYYLASLTSALREANQDLRNQLQKERTEERRKMCKMAEHKSAEPAVNSITARWRKVLEASSPLTPTVPGNITDVDENKMQARKELLARIMKKALRKGSITSEEESIGTNRNEDDETDTEHHDSLPHDEEEISPNERTYKSVYNADRKPNLKSAYNIKKQSLMDIVQLARRSNTKEEHPRGLFNANKYSFSTNDSNSQQRTFSERRKSLIRKPSDISSEKYKRKFQQQSDTYKVVNEKPKDIDYKSKSRSPEPQIFKFDDISIKEPRYRTKFTEQQSYSSEKTKKIISLANPTPIKEQSPKEVRNTESVIDKITTGMNRNKIGSFLSLVKEAVNSKRNEERCQELGIEAPTLDSGTIPPVSDSIQLRDDSETSVWSENIPVITISKTESEECILEENEKLKEQKP